MLQHLLPDESDEARSIAAAKKRVMPVPLPCGTNGSAHAVEHIRALQRYLASQLLVDVTAPPAAGCAPETQTALNPQLYELVVSGYGAVSDMSACWWVDEERAHSSPPKAKASSGPPAAGRAALPKGPMLAALRSLSTGLRSVVLSHNYSLEQLPLEALHCLPNLTSLDLSYNTLAELPSTLLFVPSAEAKSGRAVAFPSLLTLNLSNNRLRWIPKDVFSVLPRLQRLAVESNALVCLPSSLGSHCSGESALREVGLWNNALVDEDRDGREAMLALGAYYIQLHTDDEFFADLQQPLSRSERAVYVHERALLPRMATPEARTGDFGPVSCDATAEMVRQLRAEQQCRQARLTRQGPPGTYYTEGDAPLAEVQCNMCQAPILPAFEAFCAALVAAFDVRERAALGPRYKEPDGDDYSFFLDGERQEHGRRHAAADPEATTTGAPWEADTELLFLLAAALLGQAWCMPAKPPVAYVKFVDAVANKNVPLVYMTCGSAVCRSAVTSLSTDANTASNFSRVDYSNLDPVSDED